MNPSKPAVTKSQQLQRAAMIRATLGTRAAAGYMHRNRWSIEAALMVLAGPQAVERMTPKEAHETAIDLYRNGQLLFSAPTNEQLIFWTPLETRA